MAYCVCDSVIPWVSIDCHFGRSHQIKKKIKCICQSGIDLSPRQWLDIPLHVISCQWQLPNPMTTSNSQQVSNMLAPESIHVSGMRCKLAHGIYLVALFAVSIERIVLLVLALDAFPIVGTAEFRIRSWSIRRLSVRKDGKVTSGRTIVGHPRGQGSNYHLLWARSSVNSNKGEGWG